MQSQQITSNFIPEDQNLDILGCKVSKLDTASWLRIFETCSLNIGTPFVILSANVYCLNLAHKLPWLKKMMNESDGVMNDSAGLEWAAKLFGSRLPSRTTWADFGWELAQYFENKSNTFYFLGNPNGIAELAKVKLQEKHPNLKVVGTHHGFFTKTGPENESVIEEVNRAKPNILIVGLGMPLQEKWVKENRDKLNVGLIIVAGNCFGFLSGTEKRAPKWMLKNGLEWFYRFLLDPFRLFNRYIIGNPIFVYRVILSRYFGISY